MQEEERRTGSVTPSEEETEKEATSKETVRDLDKSVATGERESGGTSQGSPSPDGQFDEPRGGAGPDNEAGPM